MPYNSTKDLPANLRKILPIHAQHIFLEAFNHAWKEYEDPHKRKYGGSQEEVSHRVAWSAVKSKYEKDEKSGKWKRLDKFVDNEEEEES